MRIFFFSLIGFFLVAPVIVLMGVSLHETGQMMFPPSNPHLGWYVFFFEQAQWREAFVRSILIASTAAFIALIIALPISYASWRYSCKSVKICINLCMISCLMPAVVMALGFLLFWGKMGYAGEPVSIIFCHAISFVALPLVTTSLGLRSIDQEWINAARTLGASERFRFFTLILPYLIPYIISGYLFVFVLSLNEYIIAFMVAGFATETLPVKVFNSLRSGFVPAMAVGAILFYFIGLIAFSINAKLGHLERLLGVSRDRQ